MSKEKRLRSVNTHFWDDNYVMELDPIEKLLFLYFLTNPLCNLIGIYEIGLKRIAFDSGIDKDMVLKILERFKKDKKFFYKDSYIIIPNFMKNQSYNDNMQKGALEMLENLPENIKSVLKDLKGFKILPNGLKSFDNIIEDEYNKNMKMNIIKEIEKFDKLNNDNFKNSFNEWIIFRKEMKKKLTESTIKKQLKFLSEQSDPITIINRSIQNGWQGLFELDKKFIKNERRKSGQDSTQSADGIGLTG